MSEHTPGPWRVIEDHYALNHYGIAQVGKFAVVSENPQTDSAEAAKADAEFIVRACNSHEYLLDALKHFRDETERGTRRGNINMTMVDEVIAKAEGRI